MLVCVLRTDWDGPGKAEPARLAFAVKGVAFEDVLLTGSSWETIKPTTPWGQVPVLEVDGQQLAQSGAINSYVGRELGHLMSPQEAKLDWYAMLNSFAITMLSNSSTFVHYCAFTNA